MKCKNCNGNLIYENGYYICNNCGSKYTVTDYYEDVDTYICYVENDDSNRRTKDSVIAQDLYHKLEAKKIRSFYGRISAANLINDEYENACNAAIHAAKTVLIIGTRKEYFEILHEKYSSFYNNKVIIPVYANMNPKEIPNGISAIQALDYNKIGSDVDLVNSLNNALGRTDEEKIYSPKSKSKTKIIILLSAIIAVVGVFCFLYWGTDLFKKDSEPQSGETKKIYASTEKRSEERSESEPVNTEQDQYDKAMGLITEKKYADAIKVLMDISGYKDSNNQLKILYSKYSGYYKNDEKNITLHFQILADNRVSAEVIGFVDGKQIKITENTTLDSLIASFNYLDSENNQGKFSIDIKNNELALTLQTDKTASELNLGDQKVQFPISEKSDVPFKEEITATTLLGFVQNKTTISQLNQRGINTTFLNPLYKDNGSSAYGIDDTNIELAVFTFDISKADIQEFYGDDNTTVSDPIVFAVSAPAEIIIPDYVGKQNDPFVKDDVLYVPDGVLSQDYRTLDFGIINLRETKKIEGSTPVCFTCKALIGETRFNDLVEYYTNPTPSNSPSSDENIDNNQMQGEDGVHFDSPNVRCSECGMTFYVPGGDTDGLTCPECGGVLLQLETDEVNHDSTNVWCHVCGIILFVTGGDSEGYRCPKCGDVLLQSDEDKVRSASPNVRCVECGIGLYVPEGDIDGLCCPHCSGVLQLHEEH